MQFLLKSSNYTLCIGTALFIQSIYAYGAYCNAFHLGWGIYGMILFTWYEYVSHRFILHHTNEGRLYHYLHGNHHLKPHGTSLHIPILYTTISSVSYFYLLTYISYQAAWNALTIYQFCYLLFEHIHMEAHHPRWLSSTSTFRISHMYHHTHNKNKGYAFTTPTWDILCGTFPHDALTYNWFAYVPIPVFSFYLGTSSKVPIT
jgi:sterol desaturase/sphingolipid hydroxylase (fatty acid hydroxylase superfamily)